MRPIRKELLVNTITIYNYYKNEDGDRVYIPSVIRRCVAYNKKNNFDYMTQTYGSNKQYSWNILLDSKNTYCEGKKYLDYKDWNKLSDYDKENFWTLQVEDVIIKGVYDPEESIEFNEEDKEHFVLKEIIEYQDKDGSIHSREIVCV